MVAAHLKSLQDLDVAAILCLPAKATVSPSGLGDVTLTQYHDVTEAGEHMVVVQALRDRWHGLSTAIVVDGFVIASNGMRRRLAEHEKWPFM